jgi:N-acetylneuraminate lyase
MMKVEKFEGLVAAPFTPMDNQGRIIIEMIPDFYDLLSDNGVTGAFINGTTGEGPSLTQKERKDQAEKWAECYNSGGKVRVINLVGGTSYNECIDNAIHSFEVGLSAIAIVGPYFFRPADEDELADFCTRIGNSVPGMPVYYYHIPSITGINISMYAFIQKITGLLPNFAGIKFTHEDLFDFQLCLNFKERAYDLLWGNDYSLLAALALGCNGGIGSTYNYAAPLYLKMIREFKSGNVREAAKLQELSVRMIRLLGKYGGVGTGKAFMRYIGFGCGKYRSPVKNMPEEMYGEFKRDVSMLNMDHLFSLKREKTPHL